MNLCLFSNSTSFKGKYFNLNIEYLLIMRSLTPEGINLQGFQKIVGFNCFTYTVGFVSLTLGFIL